MDLSDANHLLDGRWVGVKRKQILDEKEETYGERVFHRSSEKSRALALIQLMIQLMIQFEFFSGWY